MGLTYYNGNIVKCCELQLYLLTGKVHLIPEFVLCHVMEHGKFNQQLCMRQGKTHLCDPGDHKWDRGN